jgi:hypothetical protein
MIHWTQALTFGARLRGQQRARETYLFLPAHAVKSDIASYLRAGRLLGGRHMHPNEWQKRGSRRPWANLLKPTIHFEVLHGLAYQVRMRLLAMLTAGHEVLR